jgi:hypothetical protein
MGSIYEFTAKDWLFGVAEDPAWMRYNYFARVSQVILVIRLPVPSSEAYLQGICYESCCKGPDSIVVGFKQHLKFEALGLNA